MIITNKLDIGSKLVELYEAFPYFLTTETYLFLQALFEASLVRFCAISSYHKTKAFDYYFTAQVLTLLS